MGQGWAVVDGSLIEADLAVIPVSDPLVTVGHGVFETLRYEAGQACHLDEHLDRLASSAAACRIAPPDRARLADEIALASRRITGPARVRITLSGGGRRVVVAVPLETARWHAPLRAVRGPHRDEPFLRGDVKHTSRAPWIVAVLRSGVDEVLLVDAAGRFTEGTTCGIIAVIGGVLWTAPHDGRILESTTVNELLDLAARLGVEVRREGPPADGPWDALYVASTTRHLAPVVELDGEALPGMCPVGRALVAAAGAAR